MTQHATPRPGDGLVLPREPKQERSRRKRDELVAAAERLFVARGFDAVSADDIAAEAGYGSGTFYNYFADKTQAFLMVVDRNLDGVAPVLAPLVRYLEQGGDARSAIRASVSELLDNRLAVPWLRRAWRVLTLTNDDVRRYHVRLNRMWEARLADFLQMGLERGVLREHDPAAMATVIRILVDGVVDDVVLGSGSDSGTDSGSGGGTDREHTLDAVALLLSEALLLPADVG